MSLVSTINPLYSVAGLAVGLLVGLTGVGGGSLMTPLLVLLFGIAPPTAVGTDLIYASITNCSGTLVHNLNRNVEWRITLRLAAGSVPASALTLIALSVIGPRGAAASHLISNVLGCALILTAAALVFRRQIVDFATRHLGEVQPDRALGLTVGLGAVLGALVTISSVGAGAIGITVLLFLYPRLPTARIVGSDIAHAVPLTFMAGLGHWMLGSVDWFLLISMLLGSLPGIAVGSYVSARVPDRVLRPVLAGTLVLVGSRLAF